MGRVGVWFRVDFKLFIKYIRNCNLNCVFCIIQEGLLLCEIGA